MSIEGQGDFFTIYFPGLYVLCFTRPRYQVSVYRTIGPLVTPIFKILVRALKKLCLTSHFETDNISSVELLLRPNK